jgi:hypothetical protein
MPHPHHAAWANFPIVMECTPESSGCHLCVSCGSKQGLWRLLDEHNRGWEENVYNQGQCGKLSEQVLTFSNPCFR